MRCIQYAPGHANSIPEKLERLDDFFQELLVLAYGKSFYILEYEIGGVQFFHDSNELSHQRVTRIVEYALTDKRKALARGTAGNDIDSAITDARLLPDLIARQTCNSLR